MPRQEWLAKNDASMEKVTGSNFDKGFAQWQDYQQAPWGKLRYRVAQANLQNHLPPPPAHILDLGGGNGLDSLPLLKLGYTAVLQNIHQSLRPGGIFFFMITNPHTETLAYALRDYDLVAAQANLTQTTKYVATFDTQIQRYTDDALKSMLQNCGFTLLEQYGIRAICDFMADNERKFDPNFYEQLEQLELAVSNKHPYKLLARFFHFVCQK